MLAFFQAEENVWELEMIVTQYRECADSDLIVTQHCEHTDGNLLVDFKMVTYCVMWISP